MSHCQKIPEAPAGTERARRLCVVYLGAYLTATAAASIAMALVT